MILAAIASGILADVDLTTDIADRVFFQRRPHGVAGSCIVLDQRGVRQLDEITGKPSCDATTVEFNVWVRGSSALPVVARIGNRLRTLYEGYRGALGNTFVHGCDLQNDIPVPVSPRDQSDSWQHRRTLTMRFTATNNIQRV